MAELPPTIRVGPYQYHVTRSAEKTAESRYNSGSPYRIGETRFKEQAINIDPATLPDRAAETLLHEVMHATWDVGARGLPEKVTEEQAICAISAPLLDTLRRNPDLVAYLMDSRP